MSTYLTLPSNASLDKYPSNTQSNYTTQLKIPLHLEGPYEVALTEFFCSSRIMVNFGTLVVINPYNLMDVFPIELKIRNSMESAEELVNEINTLIKNQTLRNNPHNLDSVYNKMIKEKLFPSLSYTDGILTLNYDSQFDLGLTGILSMLFFEKSEYITKTSKSVPFQPILSKITQYAAIYLDIIPDQMVGDSLAPILQIISFNAYEQKDTIHLFENPHYIRLNKNIISSINIRILDLQGNQIKFSDIFALSILKIHLRKIRDE